VLDQAMLMVVEAAAAAITTEGEVMVIVEEMARDHQVGVETVTYAASRAIGRGSVVANSPRRKKPPIWPKMRSRVFCSRNWR
jgi:hypothetical protein